MVCMTLPWRGMDSNFQYAGAVNLAAIPAPRPTPPLRNRKFARLSAGGRWIRTSGSAREALSRFDLLRFIYVKKDQSDGGARKAKAKRGQHDTPVKAVREPADWNLEREPTKLQHGHCDRLARCYCL